MHKQGQAFGICLASKVRKPVWAAREGAKGWWCLMRNFVKSALRQSRSACSLS